MTRKEEEHFACRGYFDSFRFHRDENKKADSENVQETPRRPSCGEFRLHIFQRAT